jgi:hypothetical protein
MNGVEAFNECFNTCIQKRKEQIFPRCFDFEIEGPQLPHVHSEPLDLDEYRKRFRAPRPLPRIIIVP